MNQLTWLNVKGSPMQESLCLYLARIGREQLGLNIALVD